MFTGEYEHTIDAKHRLAIPSEIRQRLHPETHGTALYLAPGPNGSLWLWPERTFHQLAAAAEQTLIPAEEMMEFEEFLFSQARRLEPDSAGRTRLPERMIARFGLSGAVTILGVRDHLELRDTGEWDSQRDEKYAKQVEIMLRARRAMEQKRNGGVEDGP